MLMEIKLNTMKNGHVPDHLYRITIIGGSGSGKTNALINLIHEQNNIDKIYLNARDLSEPKYEYMHLNNPNIFIKRSNTMDDVYDNIND